METAEASDMKGCEPIVRSAPQSSAFFIYITCVKIR